MGQKKQGQGGLGLPEKKCGFLISGKLGGFEAGKKKVEDENELVDPLTDATPKKKKTPIIKSNAPTKSCLLGPNILCIG